MITPEITGNESEEASVAALKQEENKSTVDENKANIPGRKQSDIQLKLYSYLMDDNGRESVKDRATRLNGGDQHISCVYFTAEALRRANVALTDAVCNTGKIEKEDKKEISLTYQLLSRGWKISRDLTVLLPGDLCFTTPDAAGRPTHSYTFMGWMREGDFDYAYVCDNQSYDYGTTYHIRM